MLKKNQGEFRKSESGSETFHFHFHFIYIYIHPPALLETFVISNSFTSLQIIFVFLWFDKILTYFMEYGDS